MSVGISRLHRIPALVLLGATSLCFAQRASPASDPHVAEEKAAERQALGFLGYLDSGLYANSYEYTGMLIRVKADRDAFAAQVGQARAGTGTPQGRQLTDARYTTSVQGAPAGGQYVILHYQSRFANRPDAVETLTLAFSNGYWRVSGYFIK